MIRAIDDRLSKNIAFLDVKEVDENWNPRMANYREYTDTGSKELNSGKYPGDVFLEWLEIFEGTYDATNFARLEEERIHCAQSYRASLGLSMDEW